MKSNPTVWALTDNIVGNSNQSISLSSKITENCEIKEIKYNFLAKLPNMILKLFPLHIKRAVLNSLRQSSPPDIIVCAGRRLAVLAVYLKKLYAEQKEVKIIQIMKPCMDPSEFELIILPQHDNFDHALPNVIRTIGALNNVNERILNTRYKFITDYPRKKRFIAVLIGGSTKNYRLTMHNTRELIAILTKIAAQTRVRLFITFGRRTPEHIKYYIEENISSTYLANSPIFSGPCPYPGMLARADCIIATSDSVSMCSEAVTSGIPTYIYKFPEFKSKKHDYFVQQLVDIGVARRLEEKTVIESYEYEPLKELERVSEIVKSR